MTIMADKQYTFRDFIAVFVRGSKAERMVVGKLFNYGNYAK